MTRKKRWDRETTIDYDTLSLPVPWQQPAAPAPIVQGTRETPQGQIGSRESDVIVPSLQAVILAGAYSLLAGVVAVMVVIGFQLAWWWVLVAVGLTLSLALAALLTKNISARQEMYWRIEEITRSDLDGDGVVGEPKHLVVEVVDHAKKQTHFLHLDVDPDKLRVFALGCLATGNVTVGRWTGRGGLLTRSQFETIRNEMLRGGLLRWVGGPERKQQGVALTPSGRVILQKLADPSPTEKD